MGLLLASAWWGEPWPERLRLPAQIIGAVLVTSGILLLLVGALQLSFASSLSPFPAPTERGQLISSGVYRLARHPMYGGGMLVALGWPILFASLAGAGVAAVLIVFLTFKARREEAWLVERFPGYESYRRQTRRRFVPFVY
jgi:protein-S-isoprenylcysteine O-methyltransferase Ste14